jgi:hypothetical protein
VFHSGLIFCERTGEWARAVRQALADSTVVIRQTRSLAECRQAAGEFRSALVVLEFAPQQLDGAIALLLELERDCPSHRAVVVAPRSLTAYEWLAREAGAVGFATSTREAGSLADVARRFLDNQPPEELELAERIWSSLPWGDPARRVPTRTGT